MAALKIICDREREIQEFDPKEYWNITALFSKNGEFSAKLAEKEGRKITVTNGDDAHIYLFGGRAFVDVGQVFLYSCGVGQS